MTFLYPGYAPPNFPFPIASDKGVSHSLHCNSLQHTATHLDEVEGLLIPRMRTTHLPLSTYQIKESVPVGCCAILFSVTTYVAAAHTNARVSLLHERRVWKGVGRGEGGGRGLWGGEHVEDTPWIWHGDAFSRMHMSHTCLIQFSSACKSFTGDKNNNHTNHKKTGCVSSKAGCCWFVWWHLVNGRKQEGSARG